MKILSLFSGYGGSEFALKLANIQHQVIGYSDIEDCANYIYALNHGTDIPQLGDITKVNAEDLEDFDLLTGGFPCQSFSIAGKREGFKAERKGQLFFEIIRIAEHKRPRWMLLENVQGLLSHDDGKTMRVILDELRGIGYFVKWDLLFSKEHGTPQTRPRVWFACFRDKVDADKFMFPEKEQLKITVKDLLEDEVDDKYYLNENQLKRLTTPRENSEFKNPKEQDLTQPIRTLAAHMSKDVCDVTYFQVADYRYDEGLRPRQDNICPTLNARKRENDLSGCPIIRNVQQRSIDRPSCQKAIKEGKPLPGGTGILERYDGIAYSLGTTPGQIIRLVVETRWRRLTPRECFRLQGFFEDQIQFGNLSDSKLYFLAGNGWDINTASKIFIQMLKGNQNKQKQIWDY